jgi:hypothetical protein
VLWLVAIPGVFVWEVGSVTSRDVVGVVSARQHLDRECLAGDLTPRGGYSAI